MPNFFLLSKCKDIQKFDIIRRSFYERRKSMTSLPEYLTEFKSKVESCLGMVIDFVEDRETHRIIYLNVA